MYVQRYIADKTKEAAKYFASITIYGLRQIGKSTLISKIFPEFQYVTLDDIEIRNYALNDPKGFLRNYSTPLIIDKIQKAPNLLEYIKIQIGETKYQELFNNENPKPLYVLSSSNQFEPQQAIAESLTGRICIFNLSSFSYNEIKERGLHSYFNPDINVLKEKGKLIKGKSRFKNRLSTRL